MRFARWQTRYRMRGRALRLEFDWIDEARFIAVPGMPGSTGPLYVGLYEYSDMAFVLDLLRAGDCFVDVGANVGSYTVLAGVACGAEVHAFEPNEDACDVLFANIRANRAENNVKVYPMVVGDSDGELEFTCDQDATNHVVTSTPLRLESTVRTPAVRLDSVLGEVDPTVLKIDVEGWELPVLRGAGDLLGKASLLACLVEINRSLERYGFQQSDVVEVLHAEGFREVGYDPRYRVLTDPPQIRANNALFVRDSEAVIARLSDAPSRKVFGRRMKHSPS